MLNEIYNRRILTLAADIPRLGRLASPDASATAVSKLCGSTVTVDLAMEGDRVVDFAHEVKACALGQASSSIMARLAVGSTADELRRVRSGMRAMLKENGPPPNGKLATRSSKKRSAIRIATPSAPKHRILSIARPFPNLATTVAMTHPSAPSGRWP